MTLTPEQLEALRKFTPPFSIEHGKFYADIVDARGELFVEFVVDTVEEVKHIDLIASLLNSAVNGKEGGA